ncbi:MAG: hypothetical protein GVY05_05660 [Bacteroidetes bacterium]|nr:hypothetical protein [Bacteroidota bacterium]
MGVLTLELLDVEELLINTLYEQFSSDQVNRILSFNRKWEWVSYLLLPIILFLKLALIAKILDAGVFFIDRELSYGKLFSLVLRAEFIFLGIPIAKFLWFYFIQTDFELFDLQTFYPLSLLNFADIKKLDQWFIYPFQILNLFEIIYWLILSYGIKKYLKIQFYQAFNVVMMSYGICLFIWIVAVMFFYLNVS